jgi:CheY-like chemotaxis protein
MADVLIIQADGQARSMLGHVLEEDGYDVAFAPDTVAALAPLYLNPHPLVVIVDGASVRPDSATLDLVSADFGPLGRHAYIVLAEPQLDEFLSLAASPLAILSSRVVQKPVTPAAIRELVARYAPRLPDLTPDPVTVDAVSR